MDKKDIKPVLLFLARFLGFYLLTNLAYGWWVTRYEPGPDPATVVSTRQASAVLSVLGYDTSTERHKTKAAQRILLGDRFILSVHEGCNGINIWIIFVGFLLAVARVDKRVLIFILAGTAVIHVLNLGRIVLLFFVALEYPDALYFLHKYFFTALLYLAIFGLWYYWIKRYGTVSFQRQ